MKTAAIPVILMLAWVNIIAEDSPKLATGVDLSSAFKAETVTEKTLARAVGEAYDWNFNKALETVRSLYGRAGGDQELVVAAESAIALPMQRIVWICGKGLILGRLPLGSALLEIFRPLGFPSKSVKMERRIL